MQIYKIAIQQREKRFYKPLDWSCPFFFSGHGMRYVETKHLALVYKVSAVESELAADIFFIFSKFNVCADLQCSFSGLNIQLQNLKPVFWMSLFCFGVVNQGDITSERLFIAKSCYQEWAAHALRTLCLQFAHALLTLCPRFGCCCRGSSRKSCKSGRAARKCEVVRNDLPLGHEGFTSESRQ